MVKNIVVAVTKTHLNSLVTAEIEIELGRMGDAHVHSGTGRNVARFAALFLLVCAEQSRVVTLLHHNERDARLVVGFQLDARLADGRQLVLQHMRELTLRHTVPVEDDPVGLKTAGRFVEHDQQLPNHTAQLLDDFLTVLLHPDRGGVPRWMGIHRSDHGRNRGLLVVSGRWVSYVRAQEDDRFVEYLRRTVVQNLICTTRTVIVLPLV